MRDAASRERIDNEDGIAMLAEGKTLIMIKPRRIRHHSYPRNVSVVLCFVVLGSCLSSDAMAYIDPGTTGMLSQVLYVIFYSALGVFFFMFRQIKQRIARMKQFLVKLIGRS